MPFFVRKAVFQPTFFGRASRRPGLGQRTGRNSGFPRYQVTLLDERGLVLKQLGHQSPNLLSFRAWVAYPRRQPSRTSQIGAR